MSPQKEKLLICTEQEILYVIQLTGEQNGFLGATRGCFNEELPGSSEFKQAYMFINKNTAEEIGIKYSKEALEYKKLNVTHQVRCIKSTLRYTWN